MGSFKVLRGGAGGRRDISAGFLEFGFLVGAVGFFAGGFLSRLREVGGALGEVLSVFLLFVDDFFVVGDVSGIGHGLL